MIRLKNDNLQKKISQTEKAIVVSDTEIVEIDEKGKAVVRDKNTGKSKEERLYGSKDEAIADYVVKGYQPLQAVAGIEEFSDDFVRDNLIPEGGVTNLLESFKDYTREAILEFKSTIDDIGNAIINGIENIEGEVTEKTNPDYLIEKINDTLSQVLSNFDEEIVDKILKIIEDKSKQG